MKAIIAIDQGTTSCRALVFDRYGRTLAVAQREFAQHFPHPGWVEHDAEEIWQTQQEITALALSRANLEPADIAAIGITNQRETTVLWDRHTGKAVAPAIVWQDRRTAAVCDALVAAGNSTAIQQKTGLIIDAYFSGTKLQWLLDHVPGARKRAERGELAFGTIDSWLVWQLTARKVHATDASNASRTMLCNIHSVDWDDELLGWLDIPRSVLPQIVSSSEIVGHTACAGLPPGIPIAGIAGDQQAALFGQACHQPGMAKNTYGTGCFMLMNTGTHAMPSQNRLLTTIAWRLAGETHYALEGSVFAAGAAVQWLRDGLGIIARSSDTESLAVSVPDSAGVFLVPAFTGLGAPYWDAAARGLLCGLTRGSTRAHIVRAALESIAFQSAELAAAMARDAGLPLRDLRVDGGASVNNFLMQFQSDLLQIPVTRPTVTETTALGAAYLAGLAVGFWKDTAEIAALWEKDRTFTPAMAPEDATARMGEWQRAVRRALT